MSDPETADLSETWARWVEAYCRLRRLPLEPFEHGWWIEVGKPQQSGRYILRSSDIFLLQQLTERIADPAVHLELPMALSVAEQVLPSGWALASPEYLMTTEIVSSPQITLPANRQLLLDVDENVIRASCIDEEGNALSRGVCIVSGPDVIFDQIVTEAKARRQGLASAVMDLLARSAVRRGANRGVLLATVEGRPFYQALGWMVLSEVSKVISPMESRSIRHLRIVSRQ